MTCNISLVNKLYNDLSIFDNTNCYSFNINNIEGWL